MFFGADYYPEHWPQARWETDARLMREAHMNVVRVGEFAWAKLEPAEGKYDFSWLDTAIDTLNRYGIRVVLGTPTATPPKWLIDKHPDILPVDENGDVRGFGSRCHYCSTNETYHWYTDLIVSKLAQRYGNHPGVVGWQIDNEFGCHSTTRCYCDSCQAAFRRWLQKKYGTIEALNEAWGTIFWSQTYSSWEEVIIPRKTVASHNPSLLLDFYRFASDMKVQYQRRQIEILRRHTRDQFITHNLMGLFPEIDYYKLGADLDFVSWDNYPRHQKTPNAPTIAMTHDLMRSIRKQNFWVMEEQSGPSGWELVSTTPRPGEIRLWTYQAVSRGADGIVYFRWRTCRFGTEEYWHGVLDHDGKPRRRYMEIQQTGAELQKLWPLLEGSTVKNEVAILYAYDELWSLQIQPNNPHLQYIEILKDYYNRLHQLNIGVDFVNHDDDFTNYKLLIAPLLYLMNSDLASRLRRFVEKGGILLTSFRSGVKDWNNVVTEKTLPGELADLLGIEIEEYESVYITPIDITAQIEGETVKGSASTWCDVIAPTEAEVVATYASEYFAGKPAVTTRKLGEGQAIYVGTRLDPDLTGMLVDLAVTAAGIQPGLLSDQGVETAVRKKDGKKIVFLLNHGDRSQTVELPEGYTDAFSGEPASGSITLEPKGVRVVMQVK